MPGKHGEKHKHNKWPMSYVYCEGQGMTNILLLCGWYLLKDPGLRPLDASGIDQGNNSSHVGGFFLLLRPFYCETSADLIRQSVYVVSKIND